MFDLLRIALEKKMDPVTLHREVKAYAKELKIKDELLKRSLNEGFSGGEKKKLEALQAVMLKPQFALFDEIDTGVDVDALKTISQFLKKHLPKETTLVFITHSTRLLKYVSPDEVLVIKNGRLVKSGKASLAQLSDGQIENALRALVPWELQRRLDAETPTRFTAPTGNSFAIDYAAEGGPKVEVRVGELYGLSVHPTVAGVPLTFSLLSPGHKPIQTTKDIPGFWKGSWADVRKELAYTPTRRKVGR